MPSVAVIIPAAGSGTRMGLDHPKQYHLLSGIPILIHTLRAFTAFPDRPADVSSATQPIFSINRIVVVAPSELLQETSRLLDAYHLNRHDISLTAGGKRRQDSVLAGITSLDTPVDILLVHDGARPLVSPGIIHRCLEAAWEHGASIAAIPVKDTLKRSTVDQQIAATIDRQHLWQAQTPQAARFSLLVQAFNVYGQQDVTDEASLLELAGIPVKLVEGSETNLKITRPEDLILAEKIIPMPASSFRIGHGYDAHRLVAGRKLILGGITIPHQLGLAGHSDADVVTHALCDAILGALGAGDIGQHFPDSDQRFKNICSLLLLEQVMELVFQQGMTIGNADVTIVCQAPKLAPYLKEMRQALARTCKTGTDRINLKATTTEKMGFVGREEGIGCHAVALLTTRERRQ